MIDLHCHILPGIDDGAKDLETSLRMLEIASNNKTQAIVATPHVIEGSWLPAWERIVTECHELQQEAQKAGINIPIYPGAEVAVSYDILDIVKAPGPYCINGGRYMLVELPAIEIPRYTEEFFFTLQTRGITPILAHPERHPVIAKDPRIVLEWVNKGILLQINAGTITGRMGERARKVAELLLVNDLVHCIGSDAHTTHSRTPNLTQAFAMVVKIIGKAKAQKIFRTNPDKIISSCDIEVSEIKVLKPVETGIIRKWIKKLLG